MPFCPVCKCEYVEGIENCPDCKVPLVDTLEESDAETEFKEIEELDEEELVEEVEKDLVPGLDEMPSMDEIEERLEQQKKLMDLVNYKSKAELISENRSGAFALLSVGIIGGAVLLLNAFKVIKLPISGFSLISLNVIMGGFFGVFVLCGILSCLKIKKLKVAAELEEELIPKVRAFVEERISKYKTEEAISPEEAYLIKCDMAVKDIEENFPDLEPGFAYYVVDKYVGDSLNED
ncbi:MAG: hypothetical protein K5796_04030 [Lachnospiraceae bacterium]|nr:hypothetical protein [Lachnospiraceae bacterium]